MIFCEMTWEIWYWKDRLWNEITLSNVIRWGMRWLSNESPEKNCSITAYSIVWMFFEDCCLFRKSFSLVDLKRMFRINLGFWKVYRLETCIGVLFCLIVILTYIHSYALYFGVLKWWNTFWKENEPLS